MLWCIVEWREVLLCEDIVSAKFEDVRGGFGVFF